ncbi:MAG: CBS domain-containing protein [Deltaproteobacteria bacterium]|nr:CBS domain-containing protein [Deltaproteobacteria bacterium]
MIVKEVMNHEVTTCSPDTTLESAAILMWDGDCGTVAVVDDEGKVAGIITDRDVCMAVALQHKSASEIQVQEVMSSHLFTCQPESDIMNALKTMSFQKVRRLPVTNDSGQVEGIISIEDLIARAERGRRGIQTPELSYDDTMTTLKAICRPHSSKGVATGTV